MAGWKLRKDKSQTETPQAETPGAESAVAVAPPMREFAAPPLEDAPELPPLPALHSPVVEDDWTLPGEQSWDATTPLEDEPVLPKETTHELSDLEAEPEFKPAHVFDLSDMGIAQPLELAPDALPLDEEEFDATNDLLFEDDEPLVFTEDVPTQPEPLVLPEPNLVAETAEDAPALIIEPEPLAEAAPLTMFLEPEPATETFPLAEPLDVETAAEPLPLVIQPEPTADFAAPLSPLEEMVAEPEPILGEPEPTAEDITASSPLEAVFAAPPAEEEAVAPPQAFVEPEPTFVEPEPMPELAAASSPAPESPFFPTPPVTEPESFTSTLRIDRSELAPAFVPPLGTSVPTVAPFILDMPAADAPTVETTHRLVVRFGRLSAPFDLTKEVTIIGRPDSEMHYYPDIEIELDDAVSRRHAEVIRRGEEYYLADAGSTNGTMLNGEKLPPHEERLLAHGDRIRVGERAEIIFE